MTLTRLSGTHLRNNPPASLYSPQKQLTIFPASLLIYPSSHPPLFFSSVLFTLLYYSPSPTCPRGLSLPLLLQSSYLHTHLS